MRRMIRVLVLAAGLLAAHSAFAEISEPDYFVDYVEQDTTLFNGSRIDTVSWEQPDTMQTWSVVAVVSPTVLGSLKTVLTNDLVNWNDDVHLGIAPEGETISEADRFAIIHQDDIGETRTIATAERIIKAGARYHIAATSDGNYLRMYVNGILAFYPVKKQANDLKFGPGQIYIGGLGRAGIRQFVGHIESVSIYTTALTDGDIAALAMAAGLLDPVNIYCYVDIAPVERDTMDAATSIDFVNGNEVITDLGNSRFIYRPDVDADWQVAAPLAPDTVSKPHSITWSNSVTPARYFVADTNGDRIVSFESLASSDTYDKTSNIAGTDLERPHDLEFNPVDGYFYGVAEPSVSGDNHILFRFRDIGDDEDVHALAPSGSDFYARSLSVVNGVVYVVNSYGPQVIEIRDFDSANDTTYTTGYAFQVSLNSIEFHNGWWYGVGRSGLNNSAQQDLFRWQNWDDFESGSGSWQDLSSLILPFAGGDTATSYNPYFLTCWNGRLFFAVYETNAPIPKPSRIYEIIDSNSAVTSVTPIPVVATRLDLRNYPNPFNHWTTISFRLPEPACVSLAVYDASGRLVKVLVRGKAQPRGGHELMWDGRDTHGHLMPPGVYFYRVEAGDLVEAKRMVLVR